ncbi:hypothetical protein I302_108359 [Kwoniella bestiolae CBS 10118]|uniref:Major facilitator superfamily (MFS) profile domain-containing protein n=1 Tax=Kwoniella bestiolae CBS 10118 TaxID=1296100 RepID=A0A1B9FVX3_9TREE|nr:hypothetical protein I302_07268 [Kwoniella bestiolae CBS 10118]OCF22918.1 hypothetical protein I302_07268 [Kwoniella bestiolae CBS 10118]
MAEQIELHEQAPRLKSVSSPQDQDKGTSQQDDVDDTGITEASLTLEEQTDLDARRGQGFEAYPDGGVAAWLQVLYCFCIMFTTLGGVYSWGIFQDALHAEQLAPSSTLAFIGSTQATLEGLCAIPISALVARFGNKNVAVVGAILSGLGPILASWCTKSVAGLFVTEGFMFGAGQALCFFCAATLPSSYFSRRRNFATGLVYAGSGVGGAALSLAANGLIKSIGLPWTFRILGILFLAINLPCAYLLKPRPIISPIHHGAQGGLTWGPVVKISLLKDIRFVLVLIGSAVALFPLFVPPFFLPLFATSIGLSSGAASSLLAGFNLASATGRIGWGVMADRWFGSLNSLLLCLAANATSTLVIWPIAGRVGPLAVFAVINGFCAGGFFSLIPGVVSSLFSDDDLPVAFSMIVSLWAPGDFLGAPIAGYLLQAFGGPDSGYEAYRPAIFYAGGLGVFSALMVFGARVKEGGSWRRRL